jgi:hypothetical protein
MLFKRKVNVARTNDAKKILWFVVMPREKPYSITTKNLNTLFLSCDDVNRRAINIDAMASLRNSPFIYSMLSYMKKSAVDRFVDKNNACVWLVTSPMDQPLIEWNEFLSKRSVTISSLALSMSSHWDVGDEDVLRAIEWYCTIREQLDTLGGYDFDSSICYHDDMNAALVQELFESDNAQLPSLPNIKKAINEMSLPRSLKDLLWHVWVKIELLRQEPRRFSYRYMKGELAYILRVHFMGTVKQVALPADGQLSAQSFNSFAMNSAAPSERRGINITA